MSAEGIAVTAEEDAYFLERERMGGVDPHDDVAGFTGYIGRSSRWHDGDSGAATAALAVHTRAANTIVRASFFGKPDGFETFRRMIANAPQGTEAWLEGNEIWLAYPPNEQIKP